MMIQFNLGYDSETDKVSSYIGDFPFDLDIKVGDLIELCNFHQYITSGEIFFPDKDSKFESADYLDVVKVKERRIFLYNEQPALLLECDNY